MIIWCRLAVAVACTLAASGLHAGADELVVRTRRQVLRPDDGGHNRWEVIEQERRLPAAQTAVILCDVWDRHWSRGATERVDQMVARMNAVARAIRARGGTVIHAPSDTMDFYRESPARKRVQQAPRVQTPEERPHEDPPLPIDDSDGGSDTGEKESHRAWHRQHPGIEIDPQADGISDSGQEIWNFLQQRGIRHVLILGVHTNMCVLNRSFAIKRLVRWDVDVMLVRDLTDTMYNPALRPYVNHDEGTRLVVAYIEKFWCPSLSSKDLLKDTARPATRPAQ